MNADSQMSLIEQMESQVLMGEIDGLAVAVNGCFGEMSPAAKSYALELGHSLARVRAILAGKITPVKPVV